MKYKRCNKYESLLAVLYRYLNVSFENWLCSLQFRKVIGSLLKLDAT